MILFFDNREDTIFAVQTEKELTDSDVKKISWLLGNSILLNSNKIENTCLGPRAVMVSPWSTNAVEELFSSFGVFSRINPTLCLSIIVFNCPEGAIFHPNALMPF